MMVGVAYVENSTPRSESKRSIDLISPIVPTWTRSSKGSPRLRNLRAQCSTSGRCRCTSASRAPSRLAWVAVSSRNVTKSSALRRRVTSTPDAGPVTAPPLSSPVMSRSMSGADLRMARLHGERDREAPVLGVGRRARGQGRQDLPGEAVVVGQGAVRRVDPGGYGQPSRTHEEAAPQVGGLVGL